MAVHAAANQRWVRLPSPSAWSRGARVCLRLQIKCEHTPDTIRMQLGYPEAVNSHVYAENASSAATGM